MCLLYSGVADGWQRAGPAGGTGPRTVPRTLPLAYGGASYEGAEQAASRRSHQRLVRHAYMHHLDSSLNEY